MFFFPIKTTNILEFFNLAWRSGIIAGYGASFKQTDYFKCRKTVKNGLVIYIKYGRYRFDSLWLETLSSPVRPLILTSENLHLQLSLNKPYVFLLSTSFGYISSEEILIFKVGHGGLLITKFF